jgi:hypothetical protein
MLLLQQLISVYIIEINFYDNICNTFNEILNTSKQKKLLKILLILFKFFFFFRLALYIIIIIIIILLFIKFRVNKI